MNHTNVHQLASFLAQTRKNPNTIGYSVSNLVDDVKASIPKRTKRKAKKAVKQVTSALNQKIDEQIESSTDKAFDYIGDKTGYKVPKDRKDLTSTASDDFIVDEATLEADKKAAADAEKAKYEATKKKYQMIALTSVVAVGGLTAVYFIATRNK